jgi:hypothetical protein
MPNASQDPIEHTLTKKEKTKIKQLGENKFEIISHFVISIFV